MTKFLSPSDHLLPQSHAVPCRLVRLPFSSPERKGKEKTKEKRDSLELRPSLFRLTKPILRQG